MEEKRRLIRVIVICLATAVLIYCVYGRMGQNELKDLEADEVESIFLAGSTGGLDGFYEYTFSDNDIYGFIELLNKVQLGRRVSDETALSVGASSYYTITYKDGKELMVSPGELFQIDDKYYVFTNYEELWDEFVMFNSMRGEE